MDVIVSVVSINILVIISSTVNPLKAQKTIT